MPLSINFVLKWIGAYPLASSPGPVQNIGKKGLVTFAKFLVCAESAYYVTVCAQEKFALPAEWYTLCWYMIHFL